MEQGLTRVKGPTINDMGGRGKIGIEYRNIPNRSPGGLDKNPGGGYFRFKGPSATLTNATYKRNFPSKLGGASIRVVPLMGISRYIFPRESLFNFFPGEGPPKFFSLISSTPRSLMVVP